MRRITTQTISLYWGEVRRHGFLVALLLLCILASVCAELYVPYLYKQVFDILASADDRAAALDSLTTLVIIIAVWNAVSMLFNRGAALFDNYLSSRMSANLLLMGFARIHLHSHRFFATNFVGSLVTRLRRFTRGFEVLFEVAIWDVLRLALRITFTLIVLFFVNPAIGYAMLVWLVVFITAQYGFSMWKQQYEIDRAEVESKTTGYLADTITNNATIKLFNGYRHERSGFTAMVERYFRLRKLTLDLDTFADIVRNTLSVLLEFAVIYFGVTYWSQGLLSIGDFVLIQTYVFEMFYHMYDFGRVIEKVYESFADAKEMVEVLTEPLEVKDAARAGQLEVRGGGVELRNVTFSYQPKGRKRRKILDAFSLSIKPGERVAIVGPSGAGKSTLLKLLLRLYDVQKGTISIDGTDITTVTQDSVRRHIALVPQDPVLFHRSVLENIRYGREDATIAQAKTAARIAHCEEFIMGLPQKYQTQVGERGVKLSGGERQRIAIARAVVKNAPILVLDEATASLDSQSEVYIQEALQTLMENRTVIVIAHRLSTIMQMDRIVVIKNGQVAEQGTHNELITKKRGIYARLWQLQAGGFID
ncbi:MAG: ABC transporter ATP-binding protein [Patescibacteria group bacterium]